MKSQRLSIAIVALCSLAASVANAQAPASWRTERLADRVHVISGGAAGNVLVLAADDALLLVDARDTNEVARLDSTLRTIAALPVRTIINTHYHGDHVGANAFFAARGATLIGHARMAQLARVDTVIPEMNDWHRVALAKAGVPKRTFTDTLALSFGGQRITVLHPSGAHTGGDAIIWLRDADVLHVGDIVEVGAPPFIDWWAGGSVDGTIAACDRILALAGPATRIVPGHGPVITRDGVRDYRDMLATIRARVHSALDSNWTRERMLAARPTAGFDDKLGGERRALGFARLVWFGEARARGR